MAEGTSSSEVISGEDYDGTYYDFIIVGGGSAGSILANRLSANSDVGVLLLECRYAPLESDLAGLFPLLTSSVFDYNITSVNDNRTSQHLQNKVMELTSGKMLGGSSAIDHMMQIHGNPQDFNDWASILGDDKWTYSNMLPYIKKTENLIDAELLSSDYVTLHGTSGPIDITREQNSVNTDIIDAAKELGYNYVPDITSNSSTVGIMEPLYANNKVRQSNALTYLGQIKSRKNLCLSLYTTAIKILIENGTAVGVQAVDASGDVYNLYVNKEVIVSAGTLNSPKLLMLSGIGPSSHLKSLGIDVLADLPVGENYQDHPTTVIAYQVEDNTSATSSLNPFKFPVPVTCLYAALNKSQTYPDYQSINLIFPQNSASMLQLCSNVLKYNNDICNTWYTANSNKGILIAVLGLTMPKSRGKILLADSDYKSMPQVYTNFYSDDAGADLSLMTESLVDFHKIPSKMNATLVDPGVCSHTTIGSDEYWKCYGLAMSTGMWHYVGTCTMGSVLDSNLRVKNVKYLRVIDASAMPTEIRGKPRAVVNMIAERGASLIMDDWKITV